MPRFGLVGIQGIKLEVFGSAFSSFFSKRFGTSSRSSSAPIRIAYSSISGAMLPLFVAKDKKLFDKYGVDVELAYIRGVAIED